MSIEPVKNKNPTEYDGINNTRNQPGQDRGSVELVAPQAVKESEGLEKQNGSGPPVSPFASTIEAHSELPQLKAGVPSEDAASRLGKDDGDTNSPPARMVSWQDMHGKDLYTVREFEPSEGGIDIEQDHEWQERKGCCCIM